MKEKTTPATPVEATKKRKKKPPYTKFAFVAIFVALVAFGGFYFTQYNKVNDKYQEAMLTTEERDNRTVAEITKVIDLPKDEKPTYVRKVADKEKLNVTRTAKEFFEKAQNDDIVVAYEKANVAVIYRPSEKKVIKSDTYVNFAAALNPITIAVIAPNEQQQNLVTQLETKNGNIQIVSKNAPKVLNGQSYVVDLTGSNAKTAQDLAAQLGIAVGTLPDGEPKPTGAFFAVVIAPPQ